MKEMPLLRRILVACSVGAARLFRINVGEAWVGDAEVIKHAPKVIRVEPGDVVIRKARRFHAGMTGMHDLVGWRTVEITPDMVGTRIAVFASVEVKGEGGRVREEQRAFLEMVQRAGGISGIARSEDDARELMQGDLRKAIDIIGKR